MSFPSVLFGFILSILFGSAFHLWRGGSLGRLIIYIVLSVSGFWGGHLIASSLGWTFDLYGDLHLLTGTVTCILVLSIGHWLGPRQVNP